MFWNLLNIEWIKTRRSKLWLLVAMGPIIGVCFALANFHANYNTFMNDPGDNGWIEAWTQVQIFYSPLIYPIIAGVYAALICRHEHIGGGWKQLLALPVKRTNVFLAKLALVCILLALTQGLLLVAYIAGGLITNIQDPLPIFTLIGYAFKGWIAVLPLAAIQMSFSMIWQSFSAPLAINMGLSLPALLIANSSFGQFYPWAQPMLAMSPADESPIQSLFVFYTLIIVLFIFALACGIRHFRKMDLT